MKKKTMVLHMYIKEVGAWKREYFEFKVYVGNIKSEKVRIHAYAIRNMMGVKNTPVWNTVEKWIKTNVGYDYVMSILAQQGKPVKEEQTKKLNC